MLFYGMAGAGKTACALELAYHHSRSPRFQGFVWYKAPDEGKDIDRALLDLAINMETQLPGIKMVHVVGDLATFKNFLPVLKQFLEKNSILIVLDNMESLLTSQGTWSDECWKLLIDALLEHNGYSRVILTSRWLPHELTGERILIETIHSLSLNEAIILAREMPNLGRMLAGRGTVALEKGRELVTRTLELVQGHPKLIELAEAQADDPEALEKALENAAKFWGKESRLASFFDKGESSQKAEDFLDVLKNWTTSLSANLPDASKTFFFFLCALEISDRKSWITERVWPNLWKHLGLAGQAPDIEEIQQSLKALVEVQSLKKCFRYDIHPVVADAGLEEIENSFRKIVDKELANFFGALFEIAKAKEMDGMGKLIVSAGLGATPYLMRLNRWDEATMLLGEAAKRDSSPRTAASVLFMLHRIIDATSGIDAERKNSRFLARLLIELNRRREAESILRPLIAICVAKGELELARAAATDLFIILRDSQPKDALELAEKIKDCSLKLRLGPWTQIEDEGLRLQALNKLGKYPDSLKAVMDLRSQMNALPEHNEQDEVVEIWNVKEVVLSTGLEAAINSGSPDQISELTAELFKNRKARGASELDLARCIFSNYSALIRMKNYPAAEKLLQTCRIIFERENAIQELVKVYGALSILMDNVNRPGSAIDFAEIATRYAYLVGNVEDISIMHNNLGNYLAKAESSKGLAHHLAEAMISYLGDRGILASSLNHLSIDFTQFGTQATPATFDQLCQIVEEVEGVKFRELFFRLEGPDANGDKVMQEVLRMARQIS